MSINNLPSPVIQMGHVEKIVEVQQNHPHMQQLAAQEEVAAALLRDKGRIDETQNSKAGKKVREKDEDEERRRRREERERQAAKALAGGDDAEDEEGSRKAESPWAGHIVNVKI